jgi:hypothetical protein
MRHALQLALCAGHMRVVHSMSQKRDAALAAQLALARGAAANAARRRHVVPPCKRREMLGRSTVHKARCEVEAVHCVAGALEHDCGRHVVLGGSDCVVQSTYERAIAA